MQKKELDEFDLKILDLLQSNARLKSGSIAYDIGLSATAVQRRIKRLRDSGVIVSEVATVDPDSVGGRITLVVGVVLERGRADVMETFKNKVRDVPEVQQCYWVTGEYDFILIVSARDMSEYGELAQQLFIDEPDIRRFDTNVSMETVKLGLQIRVSR